MKFTESHEWIVVENGIATIGITNHAQKELGEVVYVELPSIGKQVTAGQEIAVLESTKAAADIYAPVSGEVISINQKLGDFIHHVNSSAENEGWLFKLKLSNPEELDSLLSREEYLSMTS